MHPDVGTLWGDAGGGSDLLGAARDVVRRPGRAVRAREFAGLWITDKEKRIAARQADYELSLAGDYADHYQQIRTRMTIPRNVAEELGQLSRGNTAVIVPVVHTLVGVDPEAFK